LCSEDLELYQIRSGTPKEMVADSTKETADPTEKTLKEKVAEPKKKVTDPKAKTSAAAQLSRPPSPRVAQTNKEITRSSTSRVTPGASSEHVSFSINSSPLVEPVDIDHLFIGCATVLPMGVAPEAMLNYL
jgi:hypothetical protein